MRRAVAVLVCLCATGLAFLANAAAASSPPRVSPGSTYLAIGDSVSFGYQEPQVRPAPNYAKASTFLGFPEHAARALRLRVWNAACPGETSSSFLKPSAQSFGCENFPGNPNVGYRKFYPLHVKYRGGQMSYAISFLRKHRGTRLVSLMIGANDFFVCQATTSDGCASASEQQAVATTLRRNVRAILSRIRNKAGYRGQIVLMRYFSLDYSSPLISAQSQMLNSVVIGAAKPYRIAIADGYGQFKAGSDKSGGSPCKAGLLTQLGDSGSCGVHPSFSGQGLLALALARAIRR
jgi:lysophospholipase L1-like esterase